MDSYHLVYVQNQKHAAIIAYPWRSHSPQATQFHFTPCPEGLHIDGIEIPGYPLSKQEKKKPDEEKQEQQH